MSKQKHTQRIVTYLAEIETAIDQSETIVLDVSSKGVDWHIDHLLKVINGTLRLLKKSNPNEYKWQFNYIRFIIFLSGYIPRGKGKAPKVVTSENAISKAMLREQLDLVKESLNDTKSLSADCNFKHPYFGMLDLTMSLKFLKIHTKHHLKIVRDILK